MSSDSRVFGKGERESTHGLFGKCILSPHKLDYKRVAIAGSPFPFPFSLSFANLSTFQISINAFA